MPDDTKVKPILSATYDAMVRNSLGTNLFRNLYVEKDGKQEDSMNNGEFSCAFFASSILALVKLIKEPHATIKSTLKDLQESQWEEISEPKAGSILVWEEVTFEDGTKNEHIGFFVGDNKAISNSYKLGYPVEHDWTFDGTRKVTSILWNKTLET